MLSPMYAPEMNETLRGHELMMFLYSPGYQANSSCDTSSMLLCTRNGTGEVLQLPTFSTAAKARVIITFILCIVSAICNLAVLWTASTNTKRKSHVRILIINLTVADLLVTFIVMPVDAVWNITVQWLAGDVSCRLLMFLKLLAMYSCAFVTVVISLDRQSAILNPLLGLWYWFSPDVLEETISHSLTHILFIFGLFNACLDPITYGLFTIHFRKGLKRYCRSATVLVESENNTTLTASFRCSLSSFRMKRRTPLGQDAPSANKEPERKTSSPFNNYLTVYHDSKSARNQIDPVNMI